MNRTLKTVKISDVRIDGDTQSRDEMDASWIQDIVNNLKHDIVYDPIEARFDGTDYWLSDGFHRYFAYKQLNVKEIEVSYLEGTQFDAQVDSYSANAKHGRIRTRADKEKAVRSALKNPLTKDKSNYEIAKICQVSQPFVAGIKNPDAKKKQAEDKIKHVQKKAKELEDTTNLISTEKTTSPKSEPDPYAGQNPDEEELKATELAIQADQEMMYKLLESDDALTTAHDEIKRLNHLNAQLEIRIHGLMNEKNEAIKMVKDLQRQVEKLRGKK